MPVCRISRSLGSQNPESARRAALMTNCTKYADPNLISSGKYGDVELHTNLRCAKCAWIIDIKYEQPRTSRSAVFAKISESKKKLEIPKKEFQIPTNRYLEPTLISTS